MNEYPISVKETLSTLIREMSDNPSLFVKNPEKDFIRKRKLPFETVMHLLISMGGNSLYKELLEDSNYDLDTATSSAFVQQREKILPFAFEFLLHEFTRSFAVSKKFQGYRLLAADGSDLHIPTDPNDPDSYFQGKPDIKGYNLLHFNALYDLCNRLYLDSVIQPRKTINEGRAFVDMVERSRIEGKVIIVADRNYESYNNFAHIEQKAWNYVIRVKDLGSNGILSGLSLPYDGEFDIPINLILTKKHTKEVRANRHIYKFISSTSTFDFLTSESCPFYPISFRVVRLLLDNGTYETLITNLDSFAFRPDTLKHIYKLRWGIETSFRELKYTIGLNNFHAKKQESILQEIFARIIMYNFAEIITSHVVISQADSRIYCYKVNFTVAVHVCRRFLRSRGNEPPLDLEALIRKNILPIRPLRKSHNNIRKTRSKPAVSFVYRVA